MNSDAIFKNYITAEHAEIAEISFIFFLSVLCELCGELLVSFSIRPAVFWPAAALKPDPPDLGYAYGIRQTVVRYSLLWPIYQFRAKMS